jgi:alkylhydroperoxidase/carboxymuconolactone decarboxylase family protein
MLGIMTRAQIPSEGASSGRAMNREMEVSMDSYYKPEHLAHFGDIAEGNDELARKFFDYYGAVFADGALTVREKALIALAVAHAVQCPYCIDAYSSECLKQGADLEEMTEAVHVSTAIRGGASLVHGLQMLEHVTKSSM